MGGDEHHDFQSLRMVSIIRICFFFWETIMTHLSNGWIDIMT